MNTADKFKIDLDVGFPHLSDAPIVEAVIDIQAIVEVPWEEASIRARLEPELAGYDFLDSQKVFHHEVKYSPGQHPEIRLQDLGLKGLRFRSSDQHYIAQFNRNGFVLSRLKPYESWEKLTREAMRLWTLFLKVSHANELRRLGVRFINRIVLPRHELRFEDYIKPAPEPPRELDLPFLAFVHHDTLAVPGYPYAINVIRTIQPGTTDSEESALLLDIDVFTLTGVQPLMENVQKNLTEMRWLKNKTFFGSLTTQALNKYT